MAMAQAPVRERGAPARARAAGQGAPPGRARAPRRPRVRARRPRPQTSPRTRPRPPRSLAAPLRACELIKDRRNARQKNQWVICIQSGFSSKNSQPLSRRRPTAAPDPGGGRAPIRVRVAATTNNALDERPLLLRAEAADGVYVLLQRASHASLRDVPNCSGFAPDRGRHTAAPDGSAFNASCWAAFSKKAGKHSTLRRTPNNAHTGHGLA